MPHPFDATTKTLVDMHPGDWVRLLGLPEGKTTLVDTDLSTVTTQADRVIRVEATPPYMLHVEFQIDNSERLDVRSLRYSVLLHYETGPPVHSLLVLLSPRAENVHLTGRLQIMGADSIPILDYRYSVLRVWQESRNGFSIPGWERFPWPRLPMSNERRFPH